MKTYLPVVYMGLGLKMLKITWKFVNFYSVFVIALLKSLMTLEEARRCTSSAQLMRNFEKYGTRS